MRPLSGQGEADVRLGLLRVAVRLMGRTAACCRAMRAPGLVLGVVASTELFDDSVVPALQPGQELFGLPGDLLSVLSRHAR